LTENNIKEFYKLERIKEGVDDVYLGELLGDVLPSAELPRRVVFKKGGTAHLDRDANLKLMGSPGIYKVLGGGEDYFIREAYDQKDTYSDWKTLLPAGEKLLAETENLALQLLEKGIIDVDRELHLTNNGEMTLKNMVITGAQQKKPTVYFFDFDPRHTIDWKKVSYDDKRKYESWLLRYKKIVKNMAQNLKQDPVAAAKSLETKAQLVLSTHKATKAFEDPPEPEHGGYQPPSFALVNASIKDASPDKKEKVAEKLNAPEKKINLPLPNIVHWIPASPFYLEKGIPLALYKKTFGISDPQEQEKAWEEIAAKYK
jgi:hypothetical protein